MEGATCIGKNDGGVMSILLASSTGRMRPYIKYVLLLR